MSKTTPNYGLIKPELTDIADITAMNKNWDKIDEELTKRATLDDTGKVPKEQLPETDPVTADNIEGVLPISNGGTGATSVEGVLQNLGLSKAITAIEVDTSSTAPSYALDPSNTNVEKRYLASNGLTSITLTKGSFSNNTEYHVTVIFKSGTTATTITNTAGVYFTGDDCDGGVFTPVASKVYEVGIWWNGLSLQGVVRGV